MIDYYELLDDYMEDKLSPELYQQFREELSINLSLQKAVDHYQLAKKISQSLIELETRKHIQQLKTHNITRTRFLRIAASIILLIGLGLIYKISIKNSSIDSEQIFASLYEKPISSTSRSGIRLMTSMDSAISLFDNRLYKSSKNLFAKILSEDSSSTISLRYLAHLAILEKEYTLAENYFKQITRNNDSNLQLEAQYNLMILVIRKDDRATAIKIYQTYFEGKDLIEKEKSKILSKWIESN